MRMSSGFLGSAGILGRCGASSNRKVTPLPGKCLPCENRPPSTWGFSCFWAPCCRSTADRDRTGCVAVATPATPPDASRASSSFKGKEEAASHLLDHCTVFNEKVLSFPDAKVRIRRTSEKKFRWRRTRIPAGVRRAVPEGSEYEVRCR